MQYPTTPSAQGLSAHRHQRVSCSHLVPILPPDLEQPSGSVVKGVCSWGSCLGWNPSSPWFDSTFQNLYFLPCKWNHDSTRHIVSLWAWREHWIRSLTSCESSRSLSSPTIMSLLPCPPQELEDSTRGARHPGPISVLQRGDGPRGFKWLAQDYEPFVG